MAEQCMICGSLREILTKNHLSEHGVTMVEYCNKYGKNDQMDLTPIVIKKEVKEQLDAEKYVGIAGRKNLHGYKEVAFRC